MSTKSKSKKHHGGGGGGGRALRRSASTKSMMALSDNGGTLEEASSSKSEDPTAAGGIVIPARKGGDLPQLLTGDLANDFHALCLSHGLEYVPAIVPRHRDPSDGSHHSAHVGNTMAGVVRALEGQRRSVKSNKMHKKSDKTPISPRGETDEPPGSKVEAMVPRKKSFSTTVASSLIDKRPCVQVELGKRTHAVTDIYIEGWKVDGMMMDILSQCCLALQDLVHLQLWDVGLTPQAVLTLASSMPRFPRLASLTLDANPLKDAKVATLMEGARRLETLSLRFCHLDDLSAYSIGCALGTASCWNKKLVTLNMSNNNIGDRGAQHLAQGLVTNRTLLVLNLAANHIGDQGASALAEVLSYIVLTHEQVLERRRKIQEKAQQLGDIPMKQHSSKSGPISQSPRQQHHLQMDKAGHERPGGDKTLKSKRSVCNFSVTNLLHSETPPSRGGSSKESNSPTKKSKREGKQQQSANASSVESSHKSRAQKQPQTLSNTPAKSRSRGEVDESRAEVEEEPHPLLEVLVRQDGDQLWLLGNRSLLSLNLARNLIGEKGLGLLWDMWRGQNVVWKNQKQRTQGLKRLVVHRNAVPPDHKLLGAMQHYMTLRDPTNRVPYLSLCKGNVPPCAIPPL